MAFSGRPNTPRFEVFNKNLRINSQAKAGKPNTTTQDPCYKRDIFIMNAF